MSTPPARSTAAPAGPDAAARARYARSLRRPRLAYYVVLAVVIVVFGTIFTVVWLSGSAAHASLHTVDTAPRALPVRSASATQTRAWSSTDRAVAGQPRYNGTVVTFSTHTLAGHDARTGARTWSYSRSDRSVCFAAQTGGVALAVFRGDGNCDEVDAFDAGTGARRWQRTLDQDGQPVDGTPSFQIANSTLLVTTPAVVYAINTADRGINQWTYARYGCRIGRAVLGTAGVLISQTCDSRVQCQGVKFCMRGRQLLLRDATQPVDDDDKSNGDKILWNVAGYTGVPASADTVITAVRPGSGRLDVLKQNSGAVTGRVALDPAPSSLTGLTAAPTDNGDIVWAGGHSYLITAATARPTWTAASTGPPSVTDPDALTDPVGSQARVVVPTTSGIAELDPSSGVATARYAVPAPGAGSRVYPLGAGFLVASASGTVVYR